MKTVGRVTPLLPLIPLLAWSALTATPVMAQERATPSPPASEQIAQALLAAPEALRDGATVWGFDPDGEQTTLREGTNDLICRASDPAAERWEVACYHASLDPWMARGRELRAEGVEGREVDEMRWAEAAEGILPLPEHSITLHILTGEGYDPEAGEVVNPFMRWVLYVPYATAESTGLSTRPARGMPWLMDPGTPGAHIMITPEG